MTTYQTGLIFLLSALTSATLWAKEPKAPVAVQIDVIATAPVLTVHLHFANLTKHITHLTKSQACANGDAKNVFTVTANGQKVRYAGALEREMAKFPADYIEIAPKAAYDVTTVVTQYDFLPGKQTYQIQYSSEIWDKTEKHRFTLTSNTVTTAFETPAK